MKTKIFLTPKDSTHRKLPMSGQILRFTRSMLLKAWTEPVARIRLDLLLLSILNSTRTSSARTVGHKEQPCAAVQKQITH